MTLNGRLTLYLEKKVFMLEEAERAGRAAERADGAVYSWKTSGRANWLERGFSRADVLGLVVLPRGLPPVIDMPDDPDEEE